MLFYFEFSCIQILLNIHINELLFCKLISNTIYVCVCVFVLACTCINVISNVIFAPLNSDPDSTSNPNVQLRGWNFILPLMRKKIYRLDFINREQ